MAENDPSRIKLAEKGPQFQQSGGSTTPSSEDADKIQHDEQPSGSSAPCLEDADKMQHGDQPSGSTTPSLEHADKIQHGNQLSGSTNSSLEDVDKIQHGDQPSGSTAPSLKNVDKPQHGDQPSGSTAPSFEDVDKKQHGDQPSGSTAPSLEHADKTQHADQPSGSTAPSLEHADKTQHGFQSSGSTAPSLEHADKTQHGDQPSGSTAPSLEHADKTQHGDQSSGSTAPSLEHADKTQHGFQPSGSTAPSLEHADKTQHGDQQPDSTTPSLEDVNRIQHSNPSSESVCPRLDNGDHLKHAHQPPERNIYTAENTDKILCSQSPSGSPRSENMYKLQYTDQPLHGATNRSEKTDNIQHAHQPLESTAPRGLEGSDNVQYAHQCPSSVAPEVENRVSGHPSDTENIGKLQLAPQSRESATPMSESRDSIQLPYQLQNITVPRSLDRSDNVIDNTIKEESISANLEEKCDYTHQGSISQSRCLERNGNTNHGCNLTQESSGKEHGLSVAHSVPSVFRKPHKASNDNSIQELNRQSTDYGHDTDTPYDTESKNPGDTSTEVCGAEARVQFLNGRHHLDDMDNGPHTHRGFDLQYPQFQPGSAWCVPGYPDVRHGSRLAMDMQTSRDVVDRQAHMADGRFSLSERRERELSSTKIFTGPDYRGVIVQDSSNVNLSIGDQSTGIMDLGTLAMMIEDLKEVFVETATYKRAEETLKTHGHTTISGASGEGKTSIALMLGEKFRKLGYQLVFVDDMDKFTLTISKDKRLFIIFDDIFGSVGLSTDVSQLKRILSQLQLYLKRSKISSCNNNPPPDLMEIENCPQFKVYAVFTTKSYNLQSALSKLDGLEFHFFTGKTVLDMTRMQNCRYSAEEKKRMFLKHRSHHNTDDSLDVEEICNSDNKIFGFPLTCSLYYKFCSFQKSSEEFFSKPLFYLRRELNQILGQTNNKSAVLILMLLCEDSLNLSELEMESKSESIELRLNEVKAVVPSASRTEMAREARNFRGTFFTEGDSLRFSHPAIYDACACALYGINPTFVLKHCSIKFLFERVQPHPVQATAVDEHLHIIFVSEEYYEIIASRLAEAICQGKHSMSVSHPILKREDVVTKLFKILESKKEQLIERRIFHSIDEGKFFLAWAMHAHSLCLFESILAVEPNFSLIEVSGALLSCVCCANGLVLKAFLQKFSEKISNTATQTALVISAEMGNYLIFDSMISDSQNLDFATEEGNNLLHFACEGGNRRIVERLLPLFDIDCRGESGQTPVMVAAYNGNEEAFNLLVTHGADVMLSDDNGRTIFHLACEGRSTSIIQRLLPLFDINSVGRNGRTPIMEAAFDGEKKVFDLLLRKGADITLTDSDGDSILHLACYGCNKVIVEQLLSVIDINCRGEKGMTSVMLAAHLEDKEIFNLLVSNGADLTLIDSYARNVLQVACTGSNTFIVECLLQSFDVNSHTENGWTPVMQAAYRGQKAVFDLLVSKGADLKMMYDSKDTVLHLACYRNNVPMVEYLLPLFDINQKGLSGMTPVMKAAYTGHSNVFNLLLSEGADLSLTDDDGDTILHLACQGGNAFIVDCLLPKFDLNCRGADGLTPVMKAADKGQKETYELLVSKGADLTVIDTHGNNLLHLACGGGNISIVKHLLPKFDINGRSKNGWSALMHAAYGGEKEVYDLLVSNGADVKLNTNLGNTALHIACKGGNMSIILELLELFDIDSPGASGWTPVMEAAYKGNKKVCLMLLERGADVTLTNSCENNVLHIACQSGNICLVKRLLKSLDINIRGADGWTPLMQAAYNNKKEVFDFLISQGADLSPVDNYGDTVFHLVCRGTDKSVLQWYSSMALYLVQFFEINSRGANGRTAVMNAAITAKKDVFDHLVTKGADLNLRDVHQNTVFHLACQGGNMSITETLLPSFDINSPGENGWTPLMIAAFNNNKDVLDLLMTKGANLQHSDRYGNTVLHLACRGGNKSIVQTLLPSFDINSRGENGWTPVMQAAFNGKKEIFELLILKGAELQQKDNYGNTIFHLACRGGNTSIVTHLLSSFDINSCGENGWSPLMNAAFNGKEDVFELLLSKGDVLQGTDNYGNSVLHLACRGGNTSIVMRLLPTFDINSRGENGWSPLMNAAFSGMKELFFALIAKAADLRLMDSHGNTVLHLACRGGDSSIVQYLLRTFDINSHGENNWTPVMEAAFNCKKTVFGLLVTKGADLKLTNNESETVLHVACRGGDKFIVEQLLQSLDVDILGRNGMTPIMNAAQPDKEDIFYPLLAKGADIKLTDKNTNTVLHFACMGGNSSIVQYLLPSFDINVRGGCGFTPVMHATFEAKKDVFDLLVMKGADLTMTDNTGDTVLHLACHGGNISIMENLLESFDINSRGEDDWTPVMETAYGGKKELFDLLVKKGADLTLTSCDNDTVFHMACKGGNKDIVRFLLPQWDINIIGGNEHTPLMKAVIGGHIDVVNLLLFNHGDFTLLDKDGDNLLHLACEAGHLDMVKHVLPYCDINLVDKLGWTPVMMAVANGHGDIFIYLVDENADLNVLDYAGEDVLTLAQRGGCSKAVQVLAPGEKMKEKWTRLMYHVLFGHNNWLKEYETGNPKLLQRDGFGDTLLHIACRGGSKQCVEHLLPSFDINVRGRFDWTPVMMAARCGHMDVFQYLVSHQADLSLQSEKGDNVLCLAQQGGHTDIVNYILALPQFLPQ